MISLWCNTPATSLGLYPFVFFFEGILLLCKRNCHVIKLFSTVQHPLLLLSCDGVFLGGLGPCDDWCCRGSGRGPTSWKTPFNMSRFDQLYRRILITKFFTKGWGKPDNLKRYSSVWAVFRVYYVMNNGWYVLCILFVMSAKMNEGRLELSVTVVLICLGSEFWTYVQPQKNEWVIIDLTAHWQYFSQIFASNLGKEYMDICPVILLSNCF